MKISTGQMLFQQAYEIRLIQLWNFVLGRVEQEKSFTSNGPDCIKSEVSSCIYTVQYFTNLCGKSRQENTMMLFAKKFYKHKVRLYQKRRLKKQLKKQTFFKNTDETYLNTAWGVIVGSPRNKIQGQWCRGSVPVGVYMYLYFGVAVPSASHTLSSK